MRKHAKQPEADPFRKARFREAARDIVAKDRYDRKYGRAVDTGGAIARALERAYRQGFEDAQSEHPAKRELALDDDAVEWALIPPRPRSAFWTICLFALGKEDIPKHAGSHLIPMTTTRGTPGWRLILPGANNFDHSFGQKTIVPLARLGLLDFADRGSDRLLLSDRGIATWRLFCGRGGQHPNDLTDV